MRSQDQPAARGSNADAHANWEARLRGIVPFLARFEAPDFQFGEWEGSKSTQPGVIQMPYYTLSDEAEAFVRAAAGNGWVVAGFDWPKWLQTPEATRLRDDEGALATASPDELACLLTACIRSDRFNEGSLAGAYESGLLTRILRRAATLLNELASSDE
jgi:hypothetical protein